MNNVAIRMLDPEQFWMLEEFCEEEGIPMLNPEWSRVVVAVDEVTEKVVGVVVCQMQAHMEPMWIKKEYQGKGIWEDMAEVIEGYLDVLAFSNGVKIGVYNQPTNAAAERICRMKGYEKSDRPLYVKVYTGDRFAQALIKEGD
jgi:hypothetical protein